ncbi:MAG: hypothetical protein IJ074_07040 [Clostridia bacterium]|nr:hypothetical protein [Clostridia bacterium]
MANRVETHNLHKENASTFGAFFLHEVENLLKAMGYVKQPEDDWLFGFCVQKVDEQIKNACNVPRIPHGLNKTAISLMAAEFLLTKLSSGQTSGLESLNFETVVKQLQEGDTNIVYAVDANSSDSAQMALFLNGLKTAAQAQFVSYRRVKW